MLVDDTLNIYSDYKDFLIVYPTDVFLWKEKKSGVNVSGYLQTQTPNSLVSSPGFGPLSTTRKAITPRSSLKQVSKTAVSTERLTHFFDDICMLLPSPSTKTHLLFHIHGNIIDDGAEACSYFVFIGLYDDDVVEDRDYAIPIMARWTTTTSANRTA